MRQNAPNPISMSIFSGVTPRMGKNSFSFCSRKVKHWIAIILKQKCARMHQILFQFSLHIECVQRISIHIQYAVEHQQYNCNQERIENNQLIGFANARPSTGVLGLPYCNFCAVQTIPKTISTQCHFVNVKSVCTPKFNHEQNLYKFC